MQAIVTKYISPTDTKGARIKATCEAGSLMLNWDHELDVESNHKAAALALAFQLGWLNCAWVCGSLNDGFVFVRAS